MNVEIMLVFIASIVVVLILAIGIQTAFAHRRKKRIKSEALKEEVRLREMEAKYNRPLNSMPKAESKPAGRISASDYRSRGRMEDEVVSVPAHLSNPLHPAYFTSDDDDRNSRTKSDDSTERSSNRGSDDDSSSRYESSSPSRSYDSDSSYGSSSYDSGSSYSSSSSSYSSSDSGSSYSSTD